MSATEYDALMSVVTPLTQEDYSIVIEKAYWPDADFPVYRVIVMDGEIVITQAESGILSEALSEAYQNTPERPK